MSSSVVGKPSIPSVNLSIALSASSADTPISPKILGNLFSVSNRLIALSIESFSTLNADDATATSPKDVARLLKPTVAFWLLPPICSVSSFTSLALLAALLALSDTPSKLSLVPLSPLEALELLSDKLSIALSAPFKSLPALAPLSAKPSILSDAPLTLFPA